MRVAGILITAICCITVIAVIAVLTGHDTHLVTGTVSSIVGMVSAGIAYYKGKSKGAKERTNGDKKTNSSG